MSLHAEAMVLIPLVYFVMLFFASIAAHAEDLSRI